MKSHPITKFQRGVGLAALFLALAATTASVRASSFIFTIDANGANEVTSAGVPNQGDPDGFITGTLTLDNGTGSGSTGSASFTLTLTNIDVSDLRGHHIHQAPETTTGPIVIDFGDPDTIRSGNTLSGTITGLPAATITNVFNNPSGFYYNLHNATYTAGAVRDQLAVPEPGTVSMLALGAAAAAVGMYRRRRTIQSLR